jgi:chromosome partitioning protein
MITTINNRKGGVGKTTTAVNLAEGLARRGYTTLIIDLDSQASTTLSLGIVKENVQTSTADLLFENIPAQKTIQKTGRNRLDLIAGDDQLANADLLLADELGRESKLKKRLKFAANSYDFIIIDTPPSLGLLSINALVAADNYIIPVSPTYLAMEGITHILESVEKVQTGLEVGVSLLGILLTMCDYRTKATTEAIDQIRTHFGSQVFDTEIRINTRLNEAQSYGESIFEYDPTSTGATYYEAFTDEYLKAIL